jgi:hypothetical protein
MKRRKFKDVRKSKLKHQIVDGNSSNKDSDLIRDTVKCGCGLEHHVVSTTNRREPW